MDKVTRALLHLEWGGDFSPINRCPACGGERPSHLSPCILDDALGEKGVLSRFDRDAARLRIKHTSTPTLPPEES